MVSGEGKKDILQTCIGNPWFVRGGHSAFRCREHGHRQGELKRSQTRSASTTEWMARTSVLPLGDLFAQHTGNVACLPESKPFERFVHEKQRMRREQSQRQQEPSAEPFESECTRLRKNRPQTDRFRSYR